MFYPRPVLAFRYCRCLRLCVCVSVCLSVCLSICLSVCLSICLSVCLSVNHLPVGAKARDPFKLGSTNLDIGCKRPWLRSILLCGLIDFDLQGKIYLESPNLTPFWGCLHHNSPQIQARITKFGPEVYNNWVKVLIVLGGNWPRLSRLNMA